LTKLLFIGDVHGKFDRYAEIIDREDFHLSFQVGDFGVGFNNGDDLLINAFQKEHRQSFFIRGNHDDPEKVRQIPGYLHDGMTLFNSRLMFIGGAWSIDWFRRTEGVTWWRDEELSISELNYMYDWYARYRPEIMVTHTCPTSIAHAMFVSRGLGLGYTMNETRTEQAFEAMLNIHQPKHWIFGHWHHTASEQFGDTMFHCLGELDTMELKI
jgi:predicted phosphodiesterase